MVIIYNGHACMMQKWDPEPPNLQSQQNRIKEHCDCSLAFKETGNTVHIYIKMRSRAHAESKEQDSTACRHARREVKNLKTASRRIGAYSSSKADDSKAAKTKITQQEEPHRAPLSPPKANPKTAPKSLRNA